MEAQACHQLLSARAACSDFKNGECVYQSPSIDEIRDYCKYEVDHLWEEVKRFENPHKFYVDLSQKLYDTKMQLLDEKGNNLMHGKSV